MADESKPSGEEIIEKIPEGMRLLEGKELYDFNEVSMLEAMFNLRVSEANSRIREHQNGLEAAKLQLQKNLSDLQLVQRRVIDQNEKYAIRDASKDIYVTKSGAIYVKDLDKKNGSVG